MKKIFVILPLILSFIFCCTKTPEEPSSYVLHLKYIGEKSSFTETAGKLFLSGNLPGDIEIGSFSSLIINLITLERFQIQFTMNLNGNVIKLQGIADINTETGSISGHGTIIGGTNRYDNATGNYTEQAQMLSQTTVSGFLTLTINER
ncbi:hypothetical protein DRQ09_10620 [candidate division KSB1 bacterium]|nr:MAG: hypothetical protein DRQ09_10620 [candidate division KSB1 bacterium]